MHKKDHLNKSPIRIQWICVYALAYRREKKIQNFNFLNESKTIFLWSVMSWKEKPLTKIERIVKFTANLDIPNKLSNTDNIDKMPSKSRYVHYIILAFKSISLCVCVCQLVTMLQTNDIYFITINSSSMRVLINCVAAQSDCVIGVITHWLSMSSSILCLC